MFTIKLKRDNKSKCKYKYIIVDSDYKRVKKNGEYIQPFDYPIQADKYIDKYLGGSKYLKPHRIKWG